MKTISVAYSLYTISEVFFISMKKHDVEFWEEFLKLGHTVIIDHYGQVA